MNAKTTPAAPAPETKTGKRPPDEFALARQLVRRVRKGDAKAATAADEWQKEREKLLAEASPVARAAAVAMLALPTNEDHVLDEQPGDPDFQTPEE